MEVMMYFESRHIQDILGIDKNKLFFWTQTKQLLKPEIEEKGRGGRSKFSFVNLLNLALIKELSEFGIELNAIKNILKAKQPVFLADEGIHKKPVITRGRTPWEVLKKEKQPGRSLYLCIAKKENKYFWSYRIEEDMVIEENISFEQGWNPVTVLIIDLTQIEQNLKDKLKLELGL